MFDTKNVAHTMQRYGSVIYDWKWHGMLCYSVLKCFKASSHHMVFNGSMPRTAASLNKTHTKIILFVSMNCIQSNCYV